MKYEKERMCGSMTAERKKMSPAMAMKLWKDFLMAECDGRETRTAWIRIDGSRICSKCGRDRRKKKLYVYCDPDHFVYLHCFRASCSTNRMITLQDFENFGFRNQEAIQVLLDPEGKSNIRMYHKSGKPMVVDDLVPSKEQMDYYWRRIQKELTPGEVRMTRMIPNLYQVFRENLEDDDPLWEHIRRSGLTDDKRWMCFANEDFDVFSCRHIFQNKKVILSTRDGNHYGVSYLRQETPESDPEAIVIAEGLFDILNVYHRFAYLENAIYIASLGQDAILTMIQYYKQKYLDSLQTLILFVDSDIYDAEHQCYQYRKGSIRRLLRQVIQKLGKEAFTNIHICYNRASKDFGDMQAPIQAIREDIKLEDILS